MVVQRQNPAYRLAPPTRRLMRRVPGAPGVGPVLKQLRKEKRPQLGPFLFSAELRAGPTPGALRDFQPAGKLPSVPTPKKSRRRRLAGCGRARQTRRAGSAPGALRDFQPAGKHLSVPMSKGSRRRKLAGWCERAGQTLRAGQHLGSCSSSGLLRARRGT